MKADVLGFSILIVLLKGKYNDMETRLAMHQSQKSVEVPCTKYKTQLFCYKPQLGTYTFCNLQIKHIYTYVQGIYRAVFENSIYF